MISALVKILLAANTPHDVIIEAIKAVETNGIDIQAEKRRAADRDRKRCLRNSADSAETSPDGFNGFSDSSLTSLTPIKENPPIGGQKKVSQQEVILPDWLPLPEWQGFQEMRNKIKKPMTARAERLAIGKLDEFRAKGHDPTEILNQSTFNDYQDLYEPKENRHAATSRGHEKPSFKSEGQRLAAKYRQDAEREEQGAASRATEPNLCIAEGVRQDSG